MTPPPLQDSDALFLDFDGTLAPLQEDRETVWLDPALAPVLQAVSQRLQGAVAIISGRGLLDLTRRTPAFLYRIGAHGLEAAAPMAEATASPEPAPPALVDAMETFAAGQPGVEIEHKGQVLAAHYRRNPLARNDVEAAVARAAAATPGYVSQPGKLVVEAKPREANKGKALRAWAARPPFAGRRPVMVGDDATDEDAFAAALSLGGVAIKVGEGQSLAPWRLADAKAVARWLEEL